MQGLAREAEGGGQRPVHTLLSTALRLTPRPSRECMHTILLDIHLQQQANSQIKHYAVILLFAAAATLTTEHCG